MSDRPVSATGGANETVVRRTAVRQVSVDGRQVRLDVAILDADARERLAAAIGWLVREEGESSVAAWQAFGTDIVGAHVEFAVADHDLHEVNAEWWSRAVHVAAAALIEVNELAPAVTRVLCAPDTLGAGATSTHLVS